MPSSGSTIQTRSLLQAPAVVLALLAEDHVVGAHLGEQPHQQLVGGLVTGVLQGPALEPLLAHLEQQVAGLGGGPGGHLVVVGVGGDRRAGVVVGHARQPRGSEPTHLTGA